MCDVSPEIPWDGRGRGRKGERGRPITSHKDLEDQKSMKEPASTHQIPNFTSLCFPRYISVSLLFLLLPLSVHLFHTLVQSLLQIITPRLCLRCTLQCAVALFFFFFFFSWPIFISWKSSLTALCVLAPLLVV